MKPKHLQIRIEQCLALAKASNCPRRKFGALLIDPARNVVLMDGYNGGPRGGGELCGGSFCQRDGLKDEDIEIVETWTWRGRCSTPRNAPIWSVQIAGQEYKQFDRDTLLDAMVESGKWNTDAKSSRQEAEEYKAELLEKYPGVESGTHMEIGCHHAEINVICNAAASGVKTDGSWLIITGELCLMCAKAIHHAGVKKVIVVKDGYAGANGMEYLHEHGVKVEYVDGPKDPRLEKKE